jgi:hypothetical protein
MKSWPDGISTRRENATRNATALEEMIDILEFQSLGLGEKEVDHWNL